jgi:hypothetical protein
VIVDLNPREHESVTQSELEHTSAPDERTPNETLGEAATATNAAGMESGWGILEW